jgi:hypothetical protein
VPFLDRAKVTVIKQLPLSKEGTSGRIFRKTIELEIKK